MFVRLVLVAVFALGLYACGKQSHEKCEEACWHQRSLHFWETAEDVISQAQESERAALREEKQADWAAMQDDKTSGSAAMCIEQCKEHGTKSQLECIMKSTTFAEANKCTR